MSGLDIQHWLLYSERCYEDRNTRNICKKMHSLVPAAPSWFTLNIKHSFIQMQIGDHLFLFVILKIFLHFCYQIFPIQNLTDLALLLFKMQEISRAQNHKGWTAAAVRADVRLEILLYIMLFFHIFYFYFPPLGEETSDFSVSFNVLSQISTVLLY